MSYVKHINVNDGSDRKFNDVTVSVLPMDATPELNSFNPVTSDGVARAIAGASGEVPVVTENDNGKVLKAVYDEGGPGVEWGDAAPAVTVDQSYDPTSENAQSGTAVAEAIAGHDYTAGNGITISGSGVVSVNDGDGLRITYDAVQSGIQVGDAFKYHVGDISAATADIGFSISISAPQFGNFFSPDPRIRGHLTVVAANPGDASIYAIGPIFDGFDWEEGVGVDGAMVHTGGNDIAVSDNVFSAFGHDAFLNCVDSNGDVLLYLCSTIDGTVLNGSGNGPGGSACASIMWGPYDNTRPYFSITLGGELAGPGRLDVANPVPVSDLSDEGKVLIVGSTGAPEWAEPQGGADQPLPALADNTLRFVFENPAFDPTNDTGCNFTGTSWSKVAESVTRNIWDCTLTSTPSSSAHFAITEPCRVIDGNFTADYRNRYLPYLFKNSTGLQSFEARFGDDDDSASCTETFRDCTSLETVVFNGVQGRVTNKLRAGSSMFAGCRSLTSFKYHVLPGRAYGDDTGFDIGAPYVFANCVNLKEIQGCCIGSFSTNYGANGIDLSGTFSGCAALESLDSVFSGANTFGGTTYTYTSVAWPSKMRPIKTAYHAFYGCTALKSFSVPLLLWDSSASAEGMFYKCASLVSVGLIDFNGKAASMKDMFNSCTSLKTVSLLRTNNVTNMSGAFYGVDYTALEKLPSLDTSSVTDVSNAFRNQKYADGALAMYQQLSQQANPPTTTTDCFTDCGSITHASDLAQIPASWGGTGT